MYALNIYLGACQRGKHRAGHGTSPLTPLKYFIGHTFLLKDGEYISASLPGDNMIAFRSADVCLPVKAGIYALNCFFVGLAAAKMPNDG
jgi:hypothetical protein